MIRWVKSFFKKKPNKCEMCKTEFYGKGYILKYKVSDYKKVFLMHLCNECGKSFEFADKRKPK